MFFLIKSVFLFFFFFFCIRQKLFKQIGQVCEFVIWQPAINLVRKCEDNWLTSIYAFNAIYLPHTFWENNHIIIFVFIEAV